MTGHQRNEYYLYSPSLCSSEYKMILFYMAIEKQRSDVGVLLAITSRQRGEKIKHKMSKLNKYYIKCPTSNRTIQTHIPILEETEH